MKKLLFLTVFIFTASLHVLAQNLVNNGDFETWTYVRQGLSGDSLVMPDSWARGAGTVGVNYFYATDSQRGNVMRLADTDPSNVQAKRFHSLTPISISSAGVFRISFYVKGNVGLRALVLVKGTTNPNTNTPSATNHPVSLGTYPSGTALSEWTKITADVSVPSTATFGEDYRLHVSWSSSVTTAPRPVCDFQIDDIVVQKLSDEGLTSITVTPLNYSSTTGTPSFLLPGFTPEQLNYSFTSSYIDVPVVEATPARASSQVAVTQATSLTGALADRTATIIVTTNDSKVTVYTIEFHKHPGFISGIPWDIRNANPVEWGEMAGVYSRNTTSGTNHGKIMAPGNTSLRCNSTSEAGFFITTPVLENGASTLSFFLKNTDIEGDDTPVVVLKSDDSNPEWTEVSRVQPTTSEWSNWKEVVVNINENAPGLRIKFVFEKTTVTSGTVYFDDVEILPYGATSIDKTSLSTTQVYGYNNQLTIESQEKQLFSVYTINGVKVKEGVISDNTVMNLHQGVYLVKVGDRTFKIVL